MNTNAIQSDNSSKTFYFRYGPLFFSFTFLNVEFQIDIETLIPTIFLTVFVYFNITKITSINWFIIFFAFVFFL